MGERLSLTLPLQLQASSAAPSWAWADPSVPRTCPAESLGTPAWDRRFRESPRRLTPHVVHLSDRELPTVPEGKGHSGAAWGGPPNCHRKGKCADLGKAPSLPGGVQGLQSPRAGVFREVTASWGPLQPGPEQVTVQWSALEKKRPPDHVAKLHRQIFKKAKKVLSERWPLVGKMTFHLSYTS